MVNNIYGVLYKQNPSLSKRDNEGSFVELNLECTV